MAEALVSLGLRCVDRREGPCVAAAVETFREAALYHEIPLERILSPLNALGIVPPPEPPPEGATAPPAAPPA